MESNFCALLSNRVAHAMGGVTLHAGGDVAVGGGDKSRSHTDVDILVTRNQDLRWLIFGEVGMIADGLMGAFEKHITDGAKDSTWFSKRADKSRRPFGGYNRLALGDLFQIPPILDSTQGRQDDARTRCPRSVLE